MLVFIKQLLFAKHTPRTPRTCAYTHSILTPTPKGRRVKSATLYSIRNETQAEPGVSAFLPAFLSVLLLHGHQSTTIAPAIMFAFKIEKEVGREKGHLIATSDKAHVFPEAPSRLLLTSHWPEPVTWPAPAARERGEANGRGEGCWGIG